MSKKRGTVSKIPGIPSSKDDTQFREALKLYESKQYKKALKLVEQTLKKNSNHGESLTLKGLILHFTDQKDEATVYIKKGITKAESNPIVDHMTGIYYRSIKEYAEAAKWFRAAVDNGATNQNILRDLATMQSQTRDYKNLKLARQQYLEAEPGYRANWTANAIALHLNKEYKNSENVLTKFEELAEGKLSENDMYEHSECLLYKNSIISDSGDFEAALKHLDSIEESAKDKLSVLEYRARYLLLLNRNKEASLIYRKLLQRNPDNIGYYYLLEVSLGTSTRSAELRLSLYEKLAKFYPKSDPPKYIPLTFLTGDKFKEKASDYIISRLKKGVPATFVNVKPLYKSKANVKAIEELVLEFFPESSKVSPTTYAWTCYFLAQHYLHLDNVEKALDYINKAVEHSPTLVELYIMKARILKHLGELANAADVMNEGRELDLQDRFINSKATKYYFRANKIDEAINTISLFTKNENSVNGVKDLHLMQANWVLLENAEAFGRLYKETLASYNKYPEPTNEEEEKEKAALKEQVDINKGLALKRYLAIIKVFGEFYNDQLDFHSYCMRRGTPRAYLDMLNWEDKLHATPIYARVVEGCASIYFDIDDELKQRTEEEEQKLKKKKNKKEKAKDTKRKEELIKKVSSSTTDTDPLGSELINTSTPLKDLEKIYVPLSSEAEYLVSAWDLGYQLYLRDGKYVLSLQSLNKLKKLTNDQYPKLKDYASQLLKHSSEDPTIPDAIKKVVEKSLSSYGL